MGVILKINFIFDFNVYMVRSILHNVGSYILCKIMLFRYKTLSMSHDPHKYFASVMFNKSEKMITKSDRSQAMLVLFRSVYGKI